MSNFNLSKIDSSETLENPVHVTKDAREAVAAIDKDGGIALWISTYADQDHPDYIVFEGGAEGIKAYTDFLALLKSSEDHTASWYEISPKLKTLVGIDLETGDLKWMFKDGKWAYDPEKFIDDADATLAQEEDDDFYEAQREHFSNRPEPDQLGDQSQRMQILAESGNDEDFFVERDPGPGGY